MGELVSVVLITWNSAHYLRRCIEGIRQQTYPRLEVIAVDNGSTDGSAALVAPVAQQVIRNEANQGFSAAANQGIAAANGEYVLLLNPDCFLLPDYAAKLVEAFERGARNLGAATGMLIRARGNDIEPAGEIDSMGIRMTRNGRHLDLNQGMPVRYAERFRETFEVFGVSGAAAMFRRAFLDAVKVGEEVFDEDFFAYREDADLAWRGRVFGWTACCEPRAIAYHVRRVTPEARRELPDAINMHSVKNRFLLRLKNEGRYLALRNGPFELARDLVVAAAALTVERSSLPAFAWLWKNRRQVLRKRAEIQKRRSVSDRDLARWFR